MANGSRRKRVVDYALGMASEALWILGMSAFALLMAIVAKAIWP